MYAEMDCNLPHGIGLGKLGPPIAYTSTRIVRKGVGGAVLMSLSVGFQSLTLPAPRWIVVFLGELNDLIQAGTGLGDAGVTESLGRMRGGTAQAPIEGF